MTQVLTRPETVQQLMQRLLDKGYTQATRQSLGAVARFSETGLLAKRLDDLEAEAQRLEAAGLPLAPDNAVLRAVQADFETVLQRDSVLTGAAGDDVQTAAAQAAATLTRQFAIGGLDGSTLASVGMHWNTPDPEAIRAAVGYTGKSAWDDLLSKYVSSISQTVKDVALRGIINGQGPLTSARDLRDLMTGLPLSTANTMLRTLQLTSYRDATALHQVANADIVQRVIRVAALDDRTCMACVALHGTEIPLGERVDDHWNGRCTAVVEVIGRDLNVTTGEDWFNALPEAQQRDQMGDAAFEAWKAGSIQLQNFVHTHDDPVFGQMVTEASLKGMLGDQAKQFYSTQRGA